MQQILVLNAKGGCGKSTIATTLAGYYASRGQITALMDYDPQGSSMKWLSFRDQERAAIHGIAAHEKRRDVTRAFQMRLPLHAQRVVIDVPAGINGLQLAEYVRQADVILVPVLPSPIDIHAAAHFIQDLLLVGKLRQSGTKLGVIANRVRENTVIFKDLEKFLNSLNLPLVATLRDSQNYIRAAEQGVGIHELEERRAEQDQVRWQGLLEWLDQLAGESASEQHLNAATPAVSWLPPRPTSFGT